MHNYCSVVSGLLSTHADRKRVDISFTVCLFFSNFVGLYVMDLSAEDKGSGVKFCTVVHRRPGQGWLADWSLASLSAQCKSYCAFKVKLYSNPGQGISHCGELCSPKSQKSDESASYREVKFMMKAQRKRHARDAPFVEYGAACGRRSACVDIGQSSLTYLCNYAERVK